MDHPGFISLHGNYPSAHLGAEVASPQGWRYPLLVKSRTGYQNLCRLITQMKLRGKKGDGYVLDEEVAQKASGLVCLTGGDEGPLAYALGTSEIHAGIEQVNCFAGCLRRENVYVELQRHFNREEESRNQAAIEIAKKLRLPLLATNRGVLCAPGAASTARCIYLHSEPSNTGHRRAIPLPKLRALSQAPR